ncbi:carbonic anhydrase family protein [Caenimonas koreensis]|uniref:carbonic anhydrase family protein n=1 Tax=Caenimonas koreensis TaxID=367474 RepID=UPI003784761E
MIERRRFLTSTGFFAAASVCGCASQSTTPASNVAGTSPACRTFDKSRQAAVSPDEALALLKQGNNRFTAGASVNCDLMAQVRATADGQAPFAAVVGCIDSRVPPELVFDQRIGDVFVARVAGNFVNTDIIGSLEFATALAGAKLIVVLGHSECGAIKGAVDNAQFGNLTAMLANIRPSVLKVRDIPGSQDSKNKRLVQAVAEQNAVDAVAALLARSDVLRTLVAQGKLKVVSAMHDVGTGKVTWAA